MTEIQSEAEEFRIIPDELQLEILSWLPGKSLAKFNCVSPNWHHSITSNAFLLHHSRLSPDPHFYLCTTVFLQFPSDFLNQVNDHPINNDYDFDFDGDGSDVYEAVNSLTVTAFGVPLMNLPRKFVFPERVAVSNFCDELVCIFSGWNRLPDLSMLLFSVRSKDYVVLPTKCEDGSESSTGYVGRLIFCSLGFDANEREYKVFRIVSGEDCLRYEILTVGCKSWKRIDHDRVPPSLRQGLPHEGSFCLNGVIYWVHENGGDSVDDDGRICLVICCFDLGCEVFEAFVVDQVVGEPYNFENHYYLTPLNGHPTLLFSGKYQADLSRWRLSEHPNAVWTRMASSYTQYWPHDHQYAGGNIRVKRSVFSEWKYECYDYEDDNSWIVKIDLEHERDQVLYIRSDMGYVVTSST